MRCGGAGPGSWGRKEEGAQGHKWVREAFVWNSALERAGISQRRRKREACARYREQVTCHMGGPWVPWVGEK